MLALFMLSIPMHSAVMLSVVYAEYCYAECCLCSVSFMLSVVTTAAGYLLALVPWELHQ